MINQGSNVPDNTIAVFIDKTIASLNKDESISRIEPFRPIPTFEEISEQLYKPPKKRSWFTSHFYRCLPLSIANQYGFVFSLPFDVELSWDGTETIDGVTIKGDPNSHFKVVSIFGSGIVTVITPYFLRTPPGINLMTINPPNYILPNITVLNGVVETDNLRGPFTFNIKLQMPGITTTIRKGLPISGILPIPRYFADGFTLKDAADIFTKEEVDEENKAAEMHGSLRLETNIKANRENSYSADRLYMRGIDIFKNKFPDHQGP